MNNKEFINEIISFYKNANERAKIKPNIHRGRIHSIYSLVEDFFGVYIDNLLQENNEYFQNNFEILIDYPFVCKAGKTKTFYPDIAVIKNNVIIKLFDIKMDLGWNRNFLPFCEEKSNFMELLLKNKIVEIRKNNQKLIYQVSPLIKYNIVLISNENISKKDRENNIENISKNENLNIYILTEGVHLNNISEETKSKLKIRDNDFDKLKDEIKSVHNTMQY
jgi:hypothetical protein